LRLTRGTRRIDSCPFRLNLYAGLITVGAAFLAFFIIGNFGDDGPDKGRDWALVFAVLMILSDLALRASYWARKVEEPENRVVRPGAVPRHISRWKKVGIAMVSPNAGGQYYMVLPVWTIGVLIVAGTMLWRSGFIEWLEKA
jgi:hypothetical protein